MEQKGQPGTTTGLRIDADPRQVAWAVMQKPKKGDLSTEGPPRR